MTNPYTLTTLERETLRTLASRVMELAALPVMKDRIRQWTAVKDLKAERPMVLFEVGTIENFIEPQEFVCQQGWLRYVEWEFRRLIRETEELQDDLVVEPIFRMGYDIRGDGYGIDLPSHHATDSEGGNIGYTFDHPIQTPEDIKRLRPQTWTVDRESSRQKWECLSEALSGIMPVELSGRIDPHVGMTNDVFKLLGNERLHMWPYDEPEALQQVLHYMSQDRIRFNLWMEKEGLLGPNNNSTIVGSGSPGYVTDLPVEKLSGETKLKDMWVWSESQETVAISPTMFKDLFLPHIAAASNLFGLVYYACCEPVHDRWDYVYKAIPNIRAVSVSPWCDQKLIASKLGKKVVFSRKPAPGPISGTDPDWNALEKDLDATLDAARDCNLEIIFRDVYRTHGDRARLARWVQMVRSRVGN